MKKSLKRLKKSLETKNFSFETISKKDVLDLIKVGLLPSKKILLLASLKALYKWRKCFSFNLKSSFRSQDI